MKKFTYLEGVGTKKYVPGDIEDVSLAEDYILFCGEADEIKPIYRSMVKNRNNNFYSEFIDFPIFRAGRMYGILVDRDDSVSLRVSILGEGSLVRFLYDMV